MDVNAIRKSLLLDVLLERYKCLICSQLLVNPIQTYRGLSACEQCYKQAIKDPTICPIDNEPVPNTGMFFRDKAKEREILNLECFCQNNSTGCPWKGTIKDFQAHMMLCAYKDSRCRHCDIQTTKEDMEEHLKKCTAIFKTGCCYYLELGCDFEANTLESMTSHMEESNVYHSFLQSDRIKSLKKENTEIKKKIQDLTDKNQHKEQLSTVKMMEMENKINLLEDLLKTLKSEMQKQIETGLNNRYVKSNNKNNSNNTKNQNAATSHQEKVKESQLEKKVEKTSLLVKELDLTLQLHENTSKSGKMIWKIDKFSHRRNQAVTGKVTALHSAPCFTGEYGYKFCARLYLNGDGMGRNSHLSLYIVIMRSEYDNLLEWPFQKRIQMSLINQKDRKLTITERLTPQKDSSSFKKPTKEMNIATGCPMFYRIDRLEKEGFMIDDCLFIEMEVIE